MACYWIYIAFYDEFQPTKTYSFLQISAKPVEGALGLTIFFLTSILLQAALVYHSRSKIRHAVVTQLFTAPLEVDEISQSDEDFTWREAGLEIPVGDETSGYLPGNKKAERWKKNFPKEAKDLEEKEAKEPKEKEQVWVPQGNETTGYQPEDGSDDEFLDSEDAYGEEIVTDSEADDELESGWNEDGPLRLIINPTKIRKVHNL